MNIPTSIYRHGLFLTGRLVNKIWPENLANRVRFPAALLLGSIMLGQTVAAQTAPLQLTLKDSIALALKQNIDVQVANINLATSQQDRKISRSALLPQASLTATDEIERYNIKAHRIANRRPAEKHRSISIR